MLLDQWITQNPPGRGTGWEPYPLSLRIVNAVKYIRSSDDERTHWLNSLALQAKVLEQRVERHIRANHLFENGKALVFAGTCCEGQAAQVWLQKGLRILDDGVSRAVPSRWRTLRTVTDVSRHDALGPL